MLLETSCRHRAAVHSKPPSSKGRGEERSIREGGSQGKVPRWGLSVNVSPGVTCLAHTLALVGFFQTAREQPGDRGSSSGTPTRAIILRAKEVQSVSYADICKLKCRCQPPPIFYPGRKIWLMSWKRLPACFQKNIKRFLVPIHRSEPRSPRPALCRGEPYQLPSQASQPPYHPQLTEAETDAERGHMTTPGPSGRWQREEWNPESTQDKPQDPRDEPLTTSEQKPGLLGPGSRGKARRRQIRDDIVSMPRLQGLSPLD